MTNRIEFDVAAGTDGTTRDDAVARIRAEYATYARKSHAVHEAKLAMARAAVKRAERAGEGARGGATTRWRRLERARRRGDGESSSEDMARDVAEAEAALRGVGEDGGGGGASGDRATSGGGAGEGGGGGGDDAGERCGRGRSEEERATYEEADEYRTTSPEGKGLREAVGEGEGEGEARASAFSRVRGLLTKKASVSRASEDVAEVGGEDGLRGA